MSVIQNKRDPFAKFDDILSKRSRLYDSNDLSSIYQNLIVIKKIGNAKFPVYLTYSKTNNENYAMKVFPYHEDKPHPFFINEIRFSSLKHSNIINVLHYENERETIHRNEIKRVSYILMEYAPYGDLFDFIIKYAEYFDEKLVRTFFRQIIEGLEYLHSKGVAHLDLKSENLLIGADFNLKIADFDLSYIKGDNQLLSHGTKFYRAPEFIDYSSSSGKKESPFASDIYSAGIILFIMKSGGVYPHSEDATLEGLNLSYLMYHKNEEFWRNHCFIQNRKPSFFDRDFKDLFNSMTRFSPSQRISIKEIKQTNWYNGSTYSPSEFKEKMKRIISQKI